MTNWRPALDRAEKLIAEVLKSQEDINKMFDEEFLGAVLKIFWCGHVDGEAVRRYRILLAIQTAKGPTEFCRIIRRIQEEK